ncbi:carboxypeptidase-like regulatory domain-containing protein [Winogradskyella immobilis]|uniref:Carboxypeptidase-like regulatory domain-containing protein n=1 Tax=Winogradskyella immobilis TaxID=2816852 RepID=A0ABS8EIU1_9FLAO|nr:carboxypeptidase-like regulatory domain-containing protein [Winogradskyella immobilis]MCC1483124.1 carboxypeptidase-like regulatory domain-containing protein [Winogradskyella immobilis]MCG0015219.1 carboxypeptidase-like regulatory domain-containing protein [Winogradskyella immobilis]
MNTQVTQAQKKSSRVIGFIGLFMIALIAFNPIYGQSTQSRTIKGTTSDEAGPLAGVTIVLKGTNVGTSSNEDGLFTFPRALSNGDTLVFTFIGYETQEFKIQPSTTSVKVVMLEDLIEIVGALNTEKPYKSKRPKTKKKQ